MLANALYKSEHLIPQRVVENVGDNQSLRKAFGTFATGVTVVTTRLNEKNYGLTVNSFSSVSLTPPLVMWCLACSSINADVFLRSNSYAINILSKNQVDISKQFCRKDGVDRFEGVDCKQGILSTPVINNCVAHFECIPEKALNVGDHIVFIGKVISFECHGGDPLVFSNGKMGGVQLS